MTILAIESSCDETPKNSYLEPEAYSLALSRGDSSGQAEPYVNTCY